MKIDIPDLTGAECGDIAITAVELGAGINYWAQLDAYEWRRWSPEPTQLDNVEVPEDFVFYTILEVSVDETWDWTIGSQFAVTPKLLNRGLALALDKRISSLTRLVSLAREDWTGEIDSDAADVIVQLGCFGKVKYS